MYPTESSRMFHHSHRLLRSCIAQNGKEIIGLGKSDVHCKFGPKNREIG